MKAGLYKFFQRNVKVGQAGKLRCNASTKQLLNEYNFGVVSAGYLHFTTQHIDQLIQTVLDENGIHLFRDKFPSKKNRIETSLSNPNEKDNSCAIRDEYVLLNSRYSININQLQTPIQGARSLGTYVAIEEIKSIEHRQLILVENLSIMAYLADLNLPSELDNALWLYRGDVNHENSTAVAYDFFRTCKQKIKQKIKLICFSDFDPQGIVIALTCGADLWLTVIDAQSKTLPGGAENDFYKQNNARTTLEKKRSAGELPKSCSRAFSTMCAMKKTIKQEHMVSHQFELDCFSLNSLEPS